MITQKAQSHTSESLRLEVLFSDEGAVLDVLLMERLLVMVNCADG